MESAVIMHDLTDEEVHRLDTDAAANDDVPRVISPNLSSAPPRRP